VTSKVKASILSVIAALSIGCMVPYVEGMSFEGQKIYLSIIGVGVAILLLVILDEFQGFLLSVMILPFTVHVFNENMFLSPIVFGVWFLSNSMLRRLNLRQLFDLKDPLVITVLVFWGTNILSYLLGFYDPVNTYVKGFGFVLSGGWDLYALSIAIVAFLRVRVLRSAKEHVKLENSLMVGVIVNIFIFIINTIHPGISWPSYFNPNPTQQNTGIRYSGTLEDYELFAEYCGITFMILVARIGVKRNLLINVSLMLVVLVGMFYTGSRGMLVALAFGFLIAGIVTRRLISTAIIVILGLVFVRLPVVYNSVLYTRLTATKLYNGFVPEDRLLVWNNALTAIRHRPVFGYGPVITRHINDFSYAHDLYLSILYQDGWVGLVAFLIFIAVYLFRTFDYKYKDNEHTMHKFSYYGHLVAVIAIFFDEIIIEFTRNAEYTVILFIFLGLVYSVLTSDMTSTS